MTFGGGLPPITFLQVETWRCSVVGPDSLGTSAKLCFKRFKAEAVDSAVRKGHGPRESQSDLIIFL